MIGVIHTYEIISIATEIMKLCVTILMFDENIFDIYRMSVKDTISSQPFRSGKGCSFLTSFESQHHKRRESER